MVGGGGTYSPKMAHLRELQIDTLFLFLKTGGGTCPLASLAPLSVIANTVEL